MALDLHPATHPETRDGAPEPSWVATHEAGTAKLTVWGVLGTREIDELDASLPALALGASAIVIDLKGVTALHPAAVAWLGARHAEHGRERPVIVAVIADGHIHARLTQADTPQLRLILE